MSGNLPRHNDKSADQRTELPHSRQRHIRSPEVIKNRGQFPNDAAAVKLLWLAICNIEDKRAAERAKERAQKRCRTAPDDSWKDRWSPTGRKHSNSSCWSTPTASSHTCKHCWKQQTKNQTTDLHKNLTRWTSTLRSSPTRARRSGSASVTRRPGKPRLGHHHQQRIPAGIGDPGFSVAGGNFNRGTWVLAILRVP